MRAVREGWWSRWGEHFCGRRIKKGFIRRVRGSRMNLCGDFGRRWGLSFAKYEPRGDAVVLVG